MIVLESPYELVAVIGLCVCSVLVLARRILELRDQVWDSRVHAAESKLYLMSLDQDSRDLLNGHDVADPPARTLE